MARRQKKLATAYDRSFAFFKEHGGGARNRGERPEVAGRRMGRILARAEREMRRRGWFVNWYPDDTPWDGDDDYVPDVVMIASLHDRDGNVIGSLGGIADPSAEYMRVVAAELASDALSEERVARRNR